MNKTIKLFYLKKRGRIKSLMKNFILLFFSSFTFFSAMGQAPTVAAPDPICDPVDVISMFSNVYTDNPVDTWLTPWSAAPVTLTDLQVAGNDTKLYEDVTFLGIEMFGTPIDATNMTTLHMDVWSSNFNQFRVKLVDFTGPQTEHEVTFTAPAQNEWVSYDIPLDDFTGLFSRSQLSQLILSAMPNTTADFYIDNVYFSNSNCIVAAPDPTENPANVISMFSNVYTDVPVNTWLTPWSQAPVTLTDLQISGNDTKLYQDVTFLGIETVGPNLIDATAMTNFRIDFWSGNATQFRIKLVDFGADMNFGGGDDTEHELTFNNPAQNEWVSYDIPLADFTGLLNTDHIAQLILSAMPNGDADFYIDNVYFYTATTAQIELCVDMSCFPGVQAPSVFGGFNGWNAGANPITDPDGDGFYCATVTMDPGPQQYKFFDQLQGPENFTTLGACNALDGVNINRVINVVAGENQSVMFGWNTCDPTCTPPPVPNVELCVDMTCLPGVQAPSVFGFFNGWNAGANQVTDPDGDGIYCATVLMDVGDQQFKFFDQLQGPEEFTTLGTCNALDGANINRFVTVSGAPQSFTFGWESCDQMCVPPPPPPDLPITFEDPGVDYNLGNFGGMISTIAIDPTDPTNMVVCSNKTNGAATWAGTVVGDDGLANPIPFTATETIMTIRVWSPNVGTPFLLKIENSAGGPTAEVLMTTTSAMTWETLVYDFTLDPAFNLANTYNKVVVFANFGNIGANQTYYFDDIMMCMPGAVALTCPPTGAAAGCSAVDVAPFADFAAFEAAGGSAMEADANSFMLINTTESGTCPVTVTHTYQISDICGFNTTTCDHTTLVEAPSGPIVTCPADQVVSCFEDIVVDPNDLVVLTSCGSTFTAYIKQPTISGGAPGCNGTVYTYIYKAVDECGRVGECEQQFLIQNVPATISVPAGGVVECFDEIELSLTDATVSGACAEYELYLTAATAGGEVGCSGTTYTYTYRLIDVCGNTVEEDVVFTQADNSGPVITSVVPTITTECLGGANPNEDFITYDVSCGTEGEVNISGPQTIGSMDCNGTRYRYTYTVTDNCGRTSAPVTLDYVVQNDGPEFSGCQDTPLQFSCEDYGGEEGTIEAIRAYIASVEASSSCGVALTVFNNFNSNNINTCINNGINSITFRATDNCGRTSFCTTTYVVVDTEAPTIYEDAQDHFEICNYNTPHNFENWLETQGGAAAYDGCSSTNVFWSTIPSNPSFNCSGATGMTSMTVTFVVRDNCGNSTNTSATFNAFAGGGFVGQDQDVLSEVENGSLETGTEVLSDNVNGITPATEFTLYQNQPNPFKEATMIGFNLPEAGTASLSVYDVSGRLIYKQDGNFAKGYNQLDLNRADLPSGILIYQVNTATDSDSKKMILLD